MVRHFFVIWKKNEKKFKKMRKLRKKNFFLILLIPAFQQVMKTTMWHIIHVVAYLKNQMALRS